MISISLIKIPLIILDAFWMFLAGTPPNQARPLKEHIVPDWRERFLKLLACPGIFLRVRIWHSGKLNLSHLQNNSFIDDVLAGRINGDTRSPRQSVSDPAHSSAHSSITRLEQQLPHSSSNHPSVCLREHINIVWSTTALVVLQVTRKTFHFRALYPQRPCTHRQGSLQRRSTPKLHRADSHHSGRLFEPLRWVMG